MFALLLTLACTSSPPVDTGSADTDTDSVDTNTDPVDTDTVDTDSGSVDTGFAPDSACDYLDMNQHPVDCGGSWASLLYFTSASGDASCPDYYTLNGTAYLDPSDAVQSQECDDTCVYSPYQAVMFLSCEARAEYIVYTGGGPGQADPATKCPNINHYQGLSGSGWYDTTEAYWADNPCP